MWFGVDEDVDFTSDSNVWDDKLVKWKLVNSYSILSEAVETQKVTFCCDLRDHSTEGDEIEIVDVFRIK